MLEIEKTMYLKTPEALYLLQKILINARGRDYLVDGEGGIE